MILPYNTDAPIYHWPVATVTIIVINVVVFFCTTMQAFLGNVEFESIEWLILQFDTINPLQWVTSAFMHADPFHLIGNMIFLWAFGLVVEGKVGGLVFALLYGIITLIDGAVVQIPMFLLGSDEGALGASGVIFALLTIAVIWAPENEMDCFYWFFFFVGSFEVRLVVLGGFYIFIQIFFLWLSVFSMSSEMLHMIGVMIGAPIGFFMLRQDLVDCEGWDLVSRNEFLQEYDLLFTDKQRKRRKQKQKSIDDPVSAALGYPQPVSRRAPAAADPHVVDNDESLPEPPPGSSKPRGKLAKLQDFFEPQRVKEQRRKAEQQPQPSPSSHPEFNRLAFAFRQAIETRSVVAATQTFQRMDHMKLSGGLGDKSLMAYVALLAQDRRWLETMRPLNIIVSHQGQMADDARLRIAQIQLSVMSKPELALRTLGQIADQVDQPSEAHDKRMKAKAKLTTAAKQALGQL